MTAQPFRLTDDELAQVDRNRSRLATIGDRGRTRDLFAEHTTEDLILVSQIISTPATRPASLPAPQLDLSFA
jgi:hypothetical protein